MDCKEFEDYIPAFVENKMDFAMTKRFLKHWKECDTCKEELNIQFLINEGLVRLEEGSAFDLQKEMRELLLHAKKKVRMHERWLKLGVFMEALVTIAVAVVLVMIIQG